jgi:hypothetical protein
VAAGVLDEDEVLVDGVLVDEVPLVDDEEEDESPEEPLEPVEEVEPVDAFESRESVR